jgi:hypothetical protein
MSTMSPEQRGDLAEQMLPVAAHLAVLVHGDGGPEDVAEALAGLDETQKNALIVVLAGLVDPEQPVGKALGWMGFDERGEMVVPASWSEPRSVRDLAPDPAVDLVDDEYVDEAAVSRFVKGFRVGVTDADFLAAIQQCAALGMTLSDVDALHRWPKKTAENWVNRLRKRYERSARVFPDLGLPRGRVFSEEEVVAMRERSFEGATDLELAMSFGTSASAVGAICRGRRYAEFGGPVRDPKKVQHLAGTREHMCGHGDNSLAALGKKQLEEAA